MRTWRVLWSAVWVSALAGCGHRSPGAEPQGEVRAAEPASEFAEALVPGKHQASAVFAMGCFWCAEKDLEAQPGVVSVQSGYAGGAADRPKYKQLFLTDHAEVVQVIYDTRATSYEALLEAFWHGVDPHDGGGQFCDRGRQYRPAIFPLDEGQLTAAQASLAAVDAALELPIRVSIEEDATFWPAETYHQDFYKKNPAHYASYRAGCRRDAKLRSVWGDEALIAH